MVVWGLSPPSPGQPVNNIDITVPAYGFPTLTNSQWFNNAAVSDAPFPPGRIRTMIANSASGPPTCPGVNCTVYQSAIASIQAVSPQAYVLGYVTVYDNVNSVFRTAAAVEADINNWLTNFPLQGIYFDQVSTDPTQIPGLYQPLATYTSGAIANAQIVWGSGALPLTDALLNVTVSPGTTVTVMYEDYYSNFTYYTPPLWVYNHPARSIFFNIHDVPEGATDMQAAINRVSQFNGGQIFLTDGLQASGNPYATLPSFWPSLVTQTGN